MGDRSAIQWTNATWNPVTGCTKVSPGCAHCYAALVANRFWPTQYPKIPYETRTGAANIIVRGERERLFTDVQCHEDRLDQPLRWKKPRKVFVNSMSDLFHEAVPDAFIDRVFAVMALAPQHTFQVLTKRAERMQRYLDYHGTRRRVAQHVEDGPRFWPLLNVWLGVSVENQHFADERIPLLLQTPAAVRFVSFEPLLADVGDISRWISEQMPTGSPLSGLEFCPRCGSGPRQRADTIECPDCGYQWSGPRLLDMVEGDQRQALPRLDWVIVGGESGPGARPFDVAWARSIVGQCQAAGVACFVKQLGSNPVETNPALGGMIGRTAYPLDRLRDRKGGTPDEWPEDLRVREMPSGR